MKALILSGGYGTRLRPQTLSKPKPLIEFGDKSIIEHQIEALIKVGVSDIIIAISHQPDAMIDYIKLVEDRHKINIRFSVEEEPLGTAGPQKLAEKMIRDNNKDDMFFVLNADIICPYPFEEMLKVHKEKKATATMVLTPVKDPSKYGVVVTDEEGKAKMFVEKPKEYITNTINAGMYLLSTDVLEKIELKPTSIEREIFPIIAQEGGLFTLKLDGFWMDVGQPKDYLIGLELWLNHLESNNDPRVSKGSNILGGCMIHPTAKVSPISKIGPNVTIGENCVIKDGVRLRNCAILSDTVINEHSIIMNTIIGWKNVIGSWVRIENYSVFGEDVKVKDELFINGTIVLSHKVITENDYEPGNIIM